MRQQNSQIFYLILYIRITKMNLLPLIFIIFFLFYCIKCVKIRQNFDEIFGNGWDKNEREVIVIKIEQNDQNEQSNKSGAVDQMGEEMGIHPNDQRKREMIKKFESIKEKLKEKGKYQYENRAKIETKIGKLLGSSRYKIYKWKKELNLNKKKMNRMKISFYEQKKSEFINRINEFKSLYGQVKQKEFVKELGISKETFRKWKKELLPKYYKTPNKFSNEEKLRKMKQYFELKKRNPKINDKIIAKELGIGCRTLVNWKREFASISNI